MAEVSTPVATTDNGADDVTSAETDKMVADLLAAAEAVAQKGLAMSIAGYDAQAASKHP